MQTVFVVGLPVIIVLAIVITVKLNELLSYLLIAALGIGSSFIVEWIFCSVLNTQCEADPLNVLGVFFHAFYAVSLCSVIYAVMPAKLKHRQP